MPRIILLDEATTNQIAAGEVVERPASVVKELMENSFDAAATRIDIEIKGGGLEEIKVVDNGVGMDEIDARMAFQRHATSKITSLLDLQEISSMGFRGEALPSIAAVSKTIMITKPRESVSGSRLEVQGGKILSQSPCGCPQGTSVTVKELFFNTPARLKHMKSLKVESGHISDIVSRLALARPDVAIRLAIDGRNVLHTPGKNNLLDTMATIYGIKTAREMISLKNFEEDITVKGLITPPSINRSSKKNITVIVNKRYVTNYLINNAVIEGYGTLLPKGRYPIAVISILIDPDQLDINVHPAKMTIRIVNESKLFKLVSRAVATALRSDIVIPSFQPLKPVTGSEIRPLNTVVLDKDASIQRQNRISNTQGPEFITATLKESNSNYSPEKNDDRHFLNHQNTILDKQPSKLEILDTGHDSPLSDIYPIGFLPSTYILAGCNKGMVVIDHHAAHERILYERILELFSREKVESQILLMPQVIQLTPKEYQIAEGHMDFFASIGIILEAFGLGSVIIREIPSGIPDMSPEELIRDLLEYLAEPGVTVNRETVVKKIAASAACKAAVKAGTRSSLEEAWEIINNLKKTKVPYTCPHGRPTIIYITEEELRHRFKRT